MLWKNCLLWIAIKGTEKPPAHIPENAKTIRREKTV
jgi:hypothetical protein